MADTGVTMNLTACTWGAVSLGENAAFTGRFGGDMVEHTAGNDTHISGTAVTRIRGFYSVRFNDRRAYLSLASLIGIENTLTARVKDMAAATGLQFSIATSRLQSVEHDILSTARPTDFVAVFFARSSDGTTSPMTLNEF